MGYFFVKQYGESTSENPLLHWIDEDYILRTRSFPTDSTDGHRFFLRELPGLFPTDTTDLHRFLFTNTNNSNRTNIFLTTD